MIPDARTDREYEAYAKERMAALASERQIVAEQQGGGWQSIDSAPKDWTDLILYVPEEDDGSGACGVCQGWYSMKDGGFDCWMTVSGPVEPTHWQQLPAPPSPTAAP